MSDRRYAISGIAALLVVCLTGLGACGSGSNVPDGIGNDVQSEQANDAYDDDVSNDSETEAEYRLEDCDGLCIYNEETGKVTLLPRFYAQLNVGGIVELNGDTCEPEEGKHYHDPHWYYYSCWVRISSANKGDDFVDFDKSSGDKLIYVSEKNYDRDAFGLYSPEQSGYWDGRRVGDYDRTFLDVLAEKNVSNASGDAVRRILQQEGLSLLRLRATGITRADFSSFENEDTSSMYVVSDKKARYTWAQYQGAKYVEGYNDVVIPYVLTGVGDKMSDGEGVDLKFALTKEGYFEIDVNPLPSGKIWCGGSDTDETGQWTRCFKAL